MSRLQPPKPVQFTRYQLLWLLRHLRGDRDLMAENLLLIEERLRAGENGTLVSAGQVAQGQLTVVNEVINLLWRALL